MMLCGRHITMSEAEFCDEWMVEMMCFGVFGGGLTCG